MADIKAVVETITETTNSIASFVQTVAEWIRQRNWINLISLLLAVIVLALLSREGISKLLGEEASRWFVWLWVAVGILFVLAVIVAVFIKPELPAPTPVVEGTAIKGLRAFAQKDAEIFRKLERNRDINSCLAMLRDGEFRIGILWGESGCGKSSFLQAGLMPELTKEESAYRGVYIKFSDKNPIETVKQEIIKTLKLNHQETESLDLLAILAQGVAVAEKPLILFFDQFEQLFVHRHQFEETYQQFIEILQQWHKAEEISLKILMSFRSDLFYFQHEIQKALNYSLSSYNNFKLEKFSPEEATNILQVIAETEAIEFDREYIKHIAETELLGKDNLISPVDLQILSLVINTQKSQEKRAFKKTALQKLGEVEGLLYQYLEERLILREKSTPISQRELLMKVLLEFIDANELTRSGAFTLSELQAKLKGMKPEEVAEAIKWLELERLITPSQQVEETAYELAHERMIPAVVKISGKILPKAYRANELLNKKVKIWMENDYSSRYLLGWRELWSIEQQKQYLIWGDKQRQKQELLRQSKRRLYRNSGILGAVGLSAMGVWGWLNYTTAGQLWQIRRDLADWSGRVQDDEYQSMAAVAFAKDGQVGQMNQLLEKIESSDGKAKALSAIAAAYSQLKETDKAVALLETALTSAQQIEDSRYKVWALRAIAEATSQLKETDQAVALLETALTIAQQIEVADYKAWALKDIAKAYSQLKETDKAVALLEKTLTIAQQIESSDSGDKADLLSAIAEATSQLKETDQAVALLETALASAQQIEDSGSKAWALRGIAEATSQLKETDQAVALLETALASAQQIEDSGSKAEALSAIAAAYSQLKDTDKAIALLEKVLVSAEQIENFSSKAEALRGIAEATSQLKETDKAVALLERATASAEQIEDSFYKADLLSAIAEATSQLKETDQAVALLETALASAQQIEHSTPKATALSYIAEVTSQLKETDQAIALLEKATAITEKMEDSGETVRALMVIAQAYSQIKDTPQAVALLKKATTIAEKIEASDSRATALSAIAEAQANLQQWGTALKITRQCPSDDCRVDSLSRVLTAYAEWQHPELKEKEE